MPTGNSSVNTANCSCAFSTQLSIRWPVAIRAPTYTARSPLSSATEAGGSCTPRRSSANSPSLTVCPCRVVTSISRSLSSASNSPLSPTVSRWPSVTTSPAVRRPSLASIVAANCPTESPNAFSSSGLTLTSTCSPATPKRWVYSVPGTFLNAASKRSA